MTDVIERKLAIAMEGIETLAKDPTAPGELRRWAQDKLQRIAVLDASLPDPLAGIGWRAYTLGRDFIGAEMLPSQRAGILAAYVAMKAADPEADPLRDPRVRDLWDAAADHIGLGSIKNRTKVGVREALAALDRKPETSPLTGLTADEEETLEP